MNPLFDQALSEGTKADLLLLEAIQDLTGNKSGQVKTKFKDKTSFGQIYIRL
jgi:hypothetical protein